MGVNPYDHDENIKGGVAYLKQQLDAFGGDQRKAAAAYNQGPGRVRGANRQGQEFAPIRETTDYVQEVAQREDFSGDIEKFLSARPATPAAQPASASAAPADSPFDFKQPLDVMAGNQPWQRAMNPPSRQPSHVTQSSQPVEKNPVRRHLETAYNTPLTRNSRPAQLLAQAAAQHEAATAKPPALKVNLADAQRQMDAFTQRQMATPERTPETFQAELLAQLQAKEAEQAKRQAALKAEGEQYGTARRIGGKLAQPAAEIVNGVYGLPAAMLRTNPNIDPAILENALGQYGQSADVLTEKLQHERARLAALPEGAGKIERGANFAADVVGEVAPVAAAAALGGSPVLAAGLSKYAQSLGQGKDPLESSKEAAFSAAGAAVGAGAERFAQGAAPSLARTALGQQVAGRTITGAAAERRGRVRQILVSPGRRAQAVATEDSRNDSARGTTAMKEKKLTPKQNRFVENYLANGGNGVGAARAAGYRGNDKTLRSIASENLTKPDIASRVRARVEGTAADADEVLALLGDHLRGDIGVMARFIRPEDNYFDLEACHAAGVSHLIKRLDQSPVNIGEQVYYAVRIEMYDAQEAAGKLINVMGLKQQPGENERAETRMKEIAQLEFERLQKAGWPPEDARSIVTDAHPRASQWIL